jgi:hypothetical protein
MTGESSLHPSGFWSAWRIVFFSTIASGALASLTLMIAWLVAHHGAGWFAEAPNAQEIMGVAIYASLCATAGGMVSATICAPLLMRKPRRRVLRNIAITSLIVGVLFSPLFIFSVVPVLIAQVIVSGVMCLDDEKVGSSVCAKCGYSLDGLDRAKTTVCPECGEALLSCGVAPASHAPRHPIGEEKK